MKRQCAKALGRTCKLGPGFKSMRGNVCQRPGRLKGSSELRDNTPALPAEVSSPGPRLSTSVTCQPLACKAKAQDTPTMPAPSTVTCRLVSKKFMSSFCSK
jgi:hypothetical protein